MRALVSSSWILLIASACSCSPSAPSACTSSAECGDGAECVDAVCVPKRDAATPDQDASTCNTPPCTTPTDAGMASLRIEPVDPVIETDGTPTDLQLHAWLGATEPPSVTWLIDDVVVGTISQTGLFTANGLVAGQVRVTARYGRLEASTTVTVHVDASQSFVDTLSPEDQTTLRTGGTPSAAFRWLYPYDGTVFPRGLTAPLLQLDGGGADVVRVTLDIEARSFHYEGFFAGSSPLRVQIPQDVWDGAARSAGAADALVVGVTKLSAGVAEGPITESHNIAQGELTGSIYYNSYNSHLAGGGAILRVRFGEDAQVVQGGCTVCHSVSANGTRISTGLSWSGTATITGTGNPIQSGTIDVDPSGTAAAAWTDPDGRKYSFGALTPDGARVLSNAVPPSNQIRGLSGTLPSRLWDATTGTEIAAPSFTDVVQYAVTPQFAPDASQVAFSWFRADGTDGRVLAVMSYDGSASPPAFGAPRTVVVRDTGMAGWPSFAPDAHSVLYQEGQHFDTSLGGGAGNPNRPSYADLRLVDLDSCDASGHDCAVSSLDRLNGYSSGAFYLPYGEAEEAHSNYEPTVLPVAVGGYYWVVFTSRRCYGNTIAPGGVVAGGEDRWGYNSGGGEVPSVRKKLWIAAIDLTGDPGSDRSHPAFYLPGQEIDAGNMRGFAALDPCRADGESCESAADCCGGFCRQTGTGDDGAPVLQCVPRPEGCSQELEACTVDGDCCGATEGVRCINQHCAAPLLQ